MSRVLLEQPGDPPDRSLVAVASAISLAFSTVGHTPAGDVVVTVSRVLDVQTIAAVYERLDGELKRLAVSVGHSFYRHDSIIFTEITVETSPFHSKSPVALHFWI
jgi:hypothetical protein